MKIICIDFETANHKSASACSVGLALLEKNRLSPIGHHFIKPHEENSYFHPNNIMIHGITPEDVLNSPEFDCVYNNYIKPYLGQVVFAAHNASFDMSVLKDSLSLYNIECPDINYICSCRISRRIWLLPSHKLSCVSEHLDFKFKHHNALEDALACGNIIKKAMEEKGFDSLDEFLESLKLPYSSLLHLGLKNNKVRSK